MLALAVSALHALVVYVLPENSKNKKKTRQNCLIFCLTDQNSLIFSVLTGFFPDRNCSTTSLFFQWIFPDMLSAISFRVIFSTL